MKKNSDWVNYKNISWILIHLKYENCVRFIMIFTVVSAKLLLKSIGKICINQMTTFLEDSHYRGILLLTWQRKKLGEPFSILNIEGKITIPYILLWQYFILFFAFQLCACQCGWGAPYEIPSSLRIIVSKPEVVTGIVMEK